MLLTVFFGLTVPAASQQRFTNLTCKMGECVWYRMAAKLDIRATDTGRIVGATTEECVTQHKGDYPASYQCQPLKTTRQDYVAHCSIRTPSIAFRDDKGKWQRTLLSISEDGEFGYNRSSIDLYLLICHDHIRHAESLDMLAAKFGYRSRAKDIEGRAQDVINSITDIANERQASAGNASAGAPKAAAVTSKGFVFGSQDVHHATNPNQTVRLGEKITPQALRQRFTGYNVRYTKGEDCLTCAVISGADGQIEVSFAQNGRTITDIRSYDDRSRDAQGNSVGSSLAKAIGSTSAKCDNGMDTTCASPSLKGLWYVVADDSKCTITAQDKQLTDIPACALIAGFQIIGD